LTSAFLLLRLFAGFAGAAAALRPLAALDVEGLVLVDERVARAETAATAFDRVVRVDAGGAFLASRILDLILAIGS
jgi:hypothetical protein